MRSKEVDDAINIVSNVRTGLMNFNELLDNNNVIINGIDKVLAYIEELEQLQNKIRDKIKELEEELELHQTYTIENDICSKLEVLKAIIGE